MNKFFLFFRYVLLFLIPVVHTLHGIVFQKERGPGSDVSEIQIYKVNERRTINGDLG